MKSFTSFFRWLLTLSIAFMILGIISEYLMLKRLPTTLQEYANLQWNGGDIHGSTATDIALTLSLTLGLVILVTGYVGLYRLKSWGRVCFIISGILIYLLTLAMPPFILSGVSYALYDLGTLCMGGALVMSYCPPLRDGFSSSLAPSKP